MLFRPPDFDRRALERACALAGKVHERRELSIEQQAEYDELRERLQRFNGAAVLSMLVEAGIVRRTIHDSDAELRRQREARDKGPARSTRRALSSGLPRP